MRQRKVSGILILALVLVIGFLVPAKEAEAGESITMLNSGSIKDVTCWYCPNEDVLTDNGVLTFTDKSTEDTKFISRVTVEANKDNPEFLVMECQVKLKQLPAGEKFVLGMGLKRIETSLGEANNIEITFINDGGLKVGVYAYEKRDNPVTIMEPKSCGASIGQTVTVRASISGDQIFKLAVGGKQVCSKEIPVSGSGRVGFLQSGNCVADISGISMKAYKYERPENTNVSEDFEDGLDISKIDIVNTNKSGITLVKPSRVAVEEYKEGNSALMFVNAPGYYFTTKYPYSNFEMTFDVPYLRLEKELYEDDGEGYFYSFGVLYGMSTNANSGFWATDATDAIVFDRYGNVMSAKREEFQNILESHKFWDEFKPISVKLSVVDGVVTLGIKWVSEKAYTTLATYTLESGSPTGYIRFAVPDLGSGSIDNLKIMNLDEKPNLIETEYKNGIVNFDEVEDAAYEPFERVYAEVEDEEDKAVINLTDKKQVAWLWLIPEAIIIGGVIIGLTVMQNKRKKDNVKEDKVNEA